MLKSSLRPWSVNKGLYLPKRATGIQSENESIGKNDVRSLYFHCRQYAHHVAILLKQNINTQMIYILKCNGNIR